jgi:precorrin-6A/cobalt-precorrin-6A reductase
MDKHRVLVLGGMTEARELAGRLAARTNIDVVLSLAGRTREPIGYPVPLRIGGFGGVRGLIDYIREREIDLMIDATHPFAEQMSRHAVFSASETGVPFFVLSRPAWRKAEGDRWTEADSIADGVVKLGRKPRRVFAAIGRQELAPLCDAPHHFYLVRSVDPIDPPLDLPDARYISERGPFALKAERKLLSGEKIDVVLAKNSGGDASYAKIVAARELGIEVVLVKRPKAARAETVDNVLDAVALARQRLDSREYRGV